MVLPVRQREVLRALYDGEDLQEGDGPSLVALHKKGLLRKDGTLSKKGKVTLGDILSSGDGPEALKEMFRL